MNILITGAAGNVGAILARHLLGRSHVLRLMIHRRGLPADLAASPNVAVYRADLENPTTLTGPCQGADCIVHCAGVLFAPRPERFLPKTNVDFVRTLVAAALAAGVRKFILISFPHVEGESSPNERAVGRLDGRPRSVHARTRLEAERRLFEACRGQDLVAVSLRSGMIYGRGILMVEAARWLLRHRLLGVWRRPTWIHLLSVPDFAGCVAAAIESEHAAGIYNLGDDHPIILQECLDTVAGHWGFHRPWRAPAWAFYLAAACCEAFATVFRTASPLTRDFMTIGMASYVSDTSRMKRDLLPHLAYPSLTEGLALL